ncbi:MAG: copper amine oxidase-like protein [Bacilli bacterium]|nr:copper amine oxidase-like protein [Bacilli bacterium]
MKRCVTLISTIAVLLFAFSGFTYADNSDLKMTVKGSNVQFSAGKPFLENGRSLFPLRDLLVALGVVNDEQHIIWDGDKQSVTAILGETKIELFVGKKEFYKNGQVSSILDVAAENVGGRIYLPARVVAEAFGFHIDYDAQAGAVLITEPSANDNKIVTNNDVDVNSNISIDANKSVDAFSDIEIKNINEALAMDKAQLFEKLVSQYDYKLPSAQKNLTIIKFIKQYFAVDLPKLVDYSISVSGSVEKGYAVNQILGAMPDNLNITMLSSILEKHPNPEVRYNAAYIISKYNNEAAFNALTQEIAIEKNEMVFGNVVAGAMHIAGINADKISQLFNKYNDLTDALKSTYNSMLFSVTYEDTNLKTAWKTFLVAKVNGGTDTDKKNANEILKGAHMQEQQSLLK